MSSSTAAPPLYTTELSSKSNMDASLIQDGCHPQLDAASSAQLNWDNAHLPPLEEEENCTPFPACVGHLDVYTRLTWQATQGWPDRSISLAFLSSTQVWELTILDKINDLILLIQVVTVPDVDDEDRVGNNLLQNSKLRIGKKN